MLSNLLKCFMCHSDDGNLLCKVTADYSDVSMTLVVGGLEV